MMTPLYPILAIAISAGTLAENPNVEAMLAELKAENERLAKRIADLEAEVRRQRADAASDPVATVPAESLGDEAGHAETPSPASTTASNVQLAIAPSTPDRPLQKDGVGFTLNASNSGGQVAISFARSTAETDVEGTTVTGFGRAWSITASAPVIKDGPRTDLATLDSFTNAAALKVRYSIFSVRERNLLTDPDYLVLEERVIAACKAKAGKDFVKQEACEEGVDLPFIEANAPELADEFRRLTHTVGSAFGIGVEGSIGYEKFEYLDIASMTKPSTDRMPWGIKLFGSIIPARETAIIPSIAFQRSYKAKDMIIHCPVPGGADSVQCLTGVNGAPSRRDKLLLALEGRRAFDLSDTRWQNGIVDRIGLSAQITYDTKSKDFGVDVPVYLVPDDKGNLIGGIRFGYATESDFVAGVFVGGTFNILK